MSFVDDLFLFGKGFFQDSILLFLCFGKYPGSLGLNIGKLFIRLASRFKRIVDVGLRCSTALMMTGNPYLERMAKTIPNETIIQNRSPESGVNNDITCYFLLE